MRDDGKVNVIIVDDIAESRENFRKLLQFESDLVVLGAARTGTEAISLAKEVDPDVVLMDINMPDMDGITATEIIKKERPYVQIVILSVQGDTNYMRRAMLAGARDFLTKPPSVDDLISTIRMAGTLSKEEREKEERRYPIHGGIDRLGPGYIPRPIILGKIIVVYSPKGGVGCTTIASNLAVTLHNEETPVVLIDANLQFGDVAIVMNERSQNSVVDLSPRVEELDREVIEDVLISHKLSGIKLLAAPIKPEQAESVDGPTFQKILKFLKTMFSYIVIDTSSMLTDVVLSSIDISDLTVLVASQDIPSISNMRSFLDLVDILGYDRSKIVFTLNRYDKRIAISPEAIGENLKINVASILPLDEKVVVPSVNRGVPFVLSNKSKPISRAMMTLTEKVRQRISELEPEEEVEQLYSRV
jgi:pilus assembly protein CpaE